VRLLLFEEFKTLNTPFLLFFDVLTALISGKLGLHQSKKSLRLVLPNVRWCLVAGGRRPGAGKWLVCSSIPSWEMLTAAASPGCPSPWGVFLTEGIPAALIYYIMFPREDAGFLQGCVGGCLACGLCQYIRLHVLRWCFGSKRTFRMELQCVQFVRCFRTSYFKEIQENDLV